MEIKTVNGLSYSFEERITGKYPEERLLEMFAGAVSD